MFLRSLILSLFLIVMAVPVLAGGDDVPVWLQQAASIKVPSYEKDIPAVVLQREVNVTVAPDGRVTTMTTLALRVLIREGREYAFARQHYRTDGGKVRDLHAWLIRPSGEAKRYDKDDIIDAAEDPNDIYDESRVKFIDVTKDADAGSVFGYQVTTEEKSIFSEDVFGFQLSRLPTLSSKYIMTLPQGWQARSATFNHQTVEPVVNGTTYTWELQNLPPIPWEARSPQITSISPRLAVKYFPPNDSKPVAIQTYANWAEVSQWLTGLHDPQWAPDAAITAKVKELTANAKTELEKIRAVARYVQDIRYISIDIGVSRGNGMRPHQASEVFAKSYGDCKDKANLMRAMLKVLDIQAYPVSIYSGDSAFVREEWASPSQFNHCIIAIKVSDATQASTILTHPKLGRLLIFDATDGDTPVGDLPEHEQGSFALVIAGDAGTLMRMPVTPPEANGLERQIQATLGPDGSLTANIRENALGSWASAYRSEYRHETRANFTKLIEGWISSGATAAKVTNLDPKDNSAEGRFNLNVDFSAVDYGQLMQNRLLVFKPTIVSRRDALALTEPRRKYPVVLHSNVFSETVRMKLPAGFEVDELPDAVKLETSFGSYQTSYAVKDGELVFTRALSQKATTIPSDQYQSVRSFYEKIRAAEQAPVVLAKK